MGMWREVGHRHTCMQFVSCCTVAGSKGQELQYVGSTLYIWRSEALQGCPPAWAELRTDGLQ